MSGAKASMSGHMTMTSRGSRVGSSSNRCSTASRMTSTWRARPWQAWTSMERSFSASSGRSSRARGPRSARTSAWIRSSREASPAAMGWWWSMCSRAPSTTCSSRASRPHEASSRFCGRVAVGSSARRATAPAASSTGAAVSHSTADGCRRKRWTSRAAARPPRAARCDAGRRVRPNSESRGGASTRSGASRSRATAVSSRSAGLGCPTFARSRRHSSACQCSSSPAAHPRTMSGRCRP